MNIYDKLKKSIEEFEFDKKNNPIKWVAQINRKDKAGEKAMQIGVRQERHLFFIYFDFDTENSEGVESTEQEAITHIEYRWGNWETFEWVK